MGDTRKLRALDFDDPDYGPYALQDAVDHIELLSAENVRLVAEIERLRCALAHRSHEDDCPCRFCRTRPRRAR